MRVERFYHSAPSAAESTAKSTRALTTTGGDFALPAHAFPKSLEAAAYALRKRLICPRWWLIGVMSQWLSKDAEQLALQLALNDGDWVLSGPPVSVKSFPVIVQLWTEIFAQLSYGNLQNECVLELELSRILRGTSSEIFAQRSFATEYLSSALRVQKVRTNNSKSQSKRSRTNVAQSPHLTLEAVGHVQVIENVVLKEGTDDTLFVTFSRDPRRLFTMEPEELLPASLKVGERKSEQDSFGSNKFTASIVSLQPDVLQAMSRSVSPKKLCSYLSIELMKTSAESTPDELAMAEGVWRGRAMGVKEIAKMHKEHLARAQSFYDHGLLSWENEAPKERVRDLVGRSPKQANAGVVHCWRMSQHALDAVQFEQALSNVFRAENTHARQLSGSAVVALESLPCLEDPQTTIGNAISAPTDDLAKVQVDVVRSMPAGNALKVQMNTARSASIDVPSSAKVHQEPKLNPVSTVDVLLTKGAASVSGTSLSSGSRIAKVGVSSETVVPGTATSGAALISKVEVSPSQSVAQSHGSNKTLSARTSVWNDDDFLMCVAEFYESLTPLQQQAFERERKRMSPEQFKRYVTPALARLRGK
ncbi:MAG: hypothetical protein RI953_1299 [Pseudomonadota bacterium]